MYTQDKDAELTALIVEYEKDIWNYAFSLTCNRHLSDDISQDVFIKAYQNLHTYRGEASIRTWLLKITRNIVVDYRRSAFFRKVVLLNRVTDHKVHPSAEHEVLEELIQEDIWKIVLKIPQKYREVLVLFAHHDLSMKEIAATIGTTEMTVKSRLYRARQMVAEIYKEEGTINGQVRI